MIEGFSRSSIAPFLKPATSPRQIRIVFLGATFFDRRAETLSPAAPEDPVQLARLYTGAHRICS